MANVPVKSRFLDHLKALIVNKGGGPPLASCNRSGRRAECLCRERSYKASGDFSNVGESLSNRYQKTCTVLCKHTGYQNCWSATNFFDPIV